MRKTTTMTAILAAVLLAATPAAMAGDWQGEAEGPFMSLETIEVEAYGNAAYYEYLGKGYIPLLEKAREAGLVMDYGVLENLTGRAGEGNVYIWWMTASMGDMQKAQELIQTEAEKMYPAETWKEMTDSMAEIRKPLATSLLRAIDWHPKAEEGGGE
jgi:hypothetical protein